MPNPMPNKPGCETIHRSQEFYPPEFAQFNHSLQLLAVIVEAEETLCRRLLLQERQEPGCRAQQLSVSRGVLVQGRHDALRIVTQLLELGLDAEPFAGLLERIERLDRILRFLKASL